MESCEVNVSHLASIYNYDADCEYVTFPDLLCFQIRFLVVPDLSETHRRAAAMKHKMWHSVSCYFVYMWCFIPSP